MSSRDDEPRLAMALTSLLALFLSVVPLPSWLLVVRPVFLMLAVIYWSLVAPRAGGIALGFLGGLALDVFKGAVLGQYALATSALAYLTIRQHLLLRNKPVFEQTIYVAIGLLLVFWLINLEISDFYSAGRYVELDLSRHLQRDLTRSFAWGIYAVTLLVIGLSRALRGLRLVSLGFLMLTVAKVFLYDLAQLTGLYRIMSFVALGASLILVSLLYQRFVRRLEPAS